MAESLANACRSEAWAIRIPMAVALVDAEGGLQFFSRMDGTLPVSTELSVSKAYTAAILRMPTHEIGPLARPGAPLQGIENSHNGRIVLFGGGFPLRLQGVVVGALGVSGGSVEQDVQVAQSAVRLLEQMERWMGKVVGLVPADMAVPHEAERVRSALQREILRQIEPPFAEDIFPALFGGISLAFM